MRNLLLCLAAMVAACFTVGGAAAVAQESPSPVISTERPSYGPSPDLIPRGSLQMESGAGVTWQSGTRVIDLPENMMRLGLTDKASTPRRA